MSEEDVVLNSPLGHETAYANQYDSGLLYPIERKLNWQDRGVLRDTLPFKGVDLWNAYEISWLNQEGKPLVRIGEFRIPAHSSHIIESKSFKLYLNSFNLTRFSSEKEVLGKMQHDLSQAAGAQVKVSLLNINDAPPIERLQGECIDDLPLNVIHYKPEPSCLQVSGKITEESLVSHLLKSNCPVTGQPDWASIQIRYKGPAIDHTGLLAYLISYREKGDFHEQCVENIFMDIWQRCKPQKLTVYARYLRRGGLDINPYRSSIASEPTNPRLSRQ